MSFLLLFTLLAAQPAHAPLPLADPVQDKNFYLLSLLKAIPDVKSLGVDKRAALSRSPFDVTSLKWSDAEIAATQQSLRALYGSSAAVRQAIDGPFRQSGAAVRYEAKPGAELLAQAWDDAARGMNRIIDVYGLNAAPRYPAIDSASYDAKKLMFPTLSDVTMLQILASVLNDDLDPDPPQFFFEPTLRYALALMDANHRDEAGRFEPLEQGQNAAAFRHAKSIQWERYPYSVIVVPGAGNERESVSLSPMGKLRVTLAVRRFRAGKAPFILVSGGFVHPNQTAHSEAMEMKRSLMEDFGVPEEAILVDPHARHTTTNMRNAAREIYRYGIPFDKKALVTSDPVQSAYIEGGVFRKRCLDELGYEPQQGLHRVNAFDLEFLPRLDSLQMDARDPLDP